MVSIIGQSHRQLREALSHGRRLIEQGVRFVQVFLKWPALGTHDKNG